MVLLAAFGLLLGRWTGEEDLVIGTPVADRPLPETEPLIGLLNSLPLRLDLSGRPSFRELLARTREVALDAHAHRGVPFERIVEAAAPERDTRRHCGNWPPSLSAAPLSLFLTLQP